MLPYLRRPPRADVLSFLFCASIELEFDAFRQFGAGIWSIGCKHLEDWVQVEAMERMKMRQQVLLNHLDPKSGLGASANANVVVRFPSRFLSGLPLNFLPKLSVFGAHHGIIAL